MALDMSRLARPRKTDEEYIRDAQNRKEKKMRDQEFTIDRWKEDAYSQLMLHLEKERNERSDTLRQNKIDENKKAIAEVKQYADELLDAGLSNDEIAQRVQEKFPLINMNATDEVRKAFEDANKEVDAPEIPEGIRENAEKKANIFKRMAKGAKSSLLTAWANYRFKKANTLQGEADMAKARYELTDNEEWLKDYKKAQRKANRATYKSKLADLRANIRSRYFEEEDDDFREEEAEPIEEQDIDVRREEANPIKQEESKPIDSTKESKSDKEDVKQSSFDGNPLTQKDNTTEQDVSMFSIERLRQALIAIFAERDDAVRTRDAALAQNKALISEKNEASKERDMAVDQMAQMKISLDSANDRLATLEGKKLPDDAELLFTVDNINEGDEITNDTRVYGYFKEPNNPKVLYMTSNAGGDSVTITRLDLDDAKSAVENIRTCIASGDMTLRLADRTPCDISTPQGNLDFYKYLSSNGVNNLVKPDAAKPSEPMKVYESQYNKIMRDVEHPENIQKYADMLLSGEIVIVPDKNEYNKTGSSSTYSKGSYGKSGYSKKDGKAGYGDTSAKSDDVPKASSKYSSSTANKSTSSKTVDDAKNNPFMPDPDQPSMISFV